MGQAEWAIDAPTTVHGTYLWFDCEVCDGITYSASPFAEKRPEVYGTALFPLPKPTVQRRWPQSPVTFLRHWPSVPGQDALGQHLPRQSSYHKPDSASQTQSERCRAETLIAGVCQSLLHQAEVSRPSPGAPPTATQRLSGWSAETGRFSTHRTGSIGSQHLR